MGSHRRSERELPSSRLHHRRTADSDSASDSYSDSPLSSRSDHRRNRRRRSPSNSDSDDGRDREIKMRRSSKKITDEDIAEYLVKKARKKALKAAKKLKAQAVSGYSNDSNPFGDSNINENLEDYLCEPSKSQDRNINRLQKDKNAESRSTVVVSPSKAPIIGRRFLWRKKIERDVAKGVPLDMFSVKAELKKQRERMAEIEKVKKRREERAIEKAQHEEEMALLARERARAEFQDWEKKEEEFHFDQSKVRSEIRLKEGRTKPIDILSRQINPSDDFDIEINEPYLVFKGLTVKEMEELREDIKLHLDLDRATPMHIEYWGALLIVSDWELAEAQKKDALARARVRGEHPPPELLAEERGLHSSIEADVKKLLEGKSCSELEVLRCQIESQMRSGTAKVVEYWEAVLKRLHIYKAKASLKEIHTKMLRRYLEQLEKPLKVEDDDMLDDKLAIKKDEESYDHNVGFRGHMLRTIKEEVEEHNDNNDAQVFSSEPLVVEPKHEVDEDDGSYSPQLLHGDDNEEAIDPEQDKVILEIKRKAVLEQQQKRIQEAVATMPPRSEENMELKAMKAMGAMEEGDAVFGSNDEINFDSKVYWWHDKYRPRKPKYFNRVHTGYEWNKYNQTHYDHDNPPPKTVQGYKFNIFYPDLVDKKTAPIFKIEKDGDSTETCIIKFEAGPPYEDIAFRIVNKEWEYSHKKGFKCTFERGILHLYFNFKRHRYRR